MSKRKKNRQKEATASPEGKRGVSIVAVSVLAVAILVAFGLWWRAPQRTDEPPTSQPHVAADTSVRALALEDKVSQPRVEAQAPPPPAAPATPAGTPATSTTPKANFQKLKGKWLRPDGGYLLEIATVAESGKLDASYHNPRPIHVARAEASQDGKTIKVFVELRDVNYPGSTYDLTYDPPSDTLQGIYYQAALQQQFEVVFVRTN